LFFFFRVVFFLFFFFFFFLRRRTGVQIYKLEGRVVTQSNRNVEVGERASASSWRNERREEHMRI